MKILVATEKPFAPVAVEGIREVLQAAGMETVLLEKYTGRAQLLEAAADADAMIVRSDKVDAAVIEAAPRLKIVVRAGAGYDNLDLDACTAHGIVAENTPGQNSNAVAELVYVDISYSTREEHSFRNNMATLGVTTMSAGSHTEPGGYARADQELAQFDISDATSPAEVAADLSRLGREPVWKDWDRIFDTSLTNSL